PPPWSPSAPDKARPARENAMTTAAAETPATPTVLIVDDNPMDRLLAGGIVQKIGGWKTAFANHGLEALDAIKGQRRDLVLTDMLMPEMDGLELVREVRRRHPGIPVILMTAHGSEETALQALQAGAASYVPKKSLARDLAETLDSVLSASQATQKQRRVLDSLAHVETSFVLENDTSLIQPLVGFLEDTIQRVQLVDPSGMILVGVALHEALTNAIFHGNLELNSSIKERDEKEYYRLANERR